MYTEKLTEIYQNYIRDENLPLLSADDLIAEIPLTFDQFVWVKNFISIWEVLAD